MPLHIDESRSNTIDKELVSEFGPTIWFQHSVPLHMGGTKSNMMDSEFVPEFGSTIWFQHSAPLHMGGANTKMMDRELVQNVVSRFGSTIRCLCTWVEPNPI